MTKYWSLGRDNTKLAKFMKSLIDIYLNMYCKETPLDYINKYNTIKYIIEYIKRNAKQTILHMIGIDDFGLNYKTITYSIEDFNTDNNIRMCSKYQEVSDIAPTMFISNIEKYTDVQYQEMSHVIVNENDLIRQNDVIILAFDECKRCNDNVICVYNIFRYEAGILIESVQDITVLSSKQYNEVLELWKENCNDIIPYEYINKLINKYFK